ncbi:MAG: asparagine synthase (glutamine-hydrolyzing) [Patescibacteria group bacterium]
MCGIAGIINLNKESVDGEKIERMLRLMDHRGPDEKGVFCRGAIGFGTARLSIIDLSTGSQPIANENETVWVSCNGEIYNFKELREQLKQSGHQFKTKSDTEVIVHAYEEWGEDFVKKIKGMFGLALLDLNKKLFYLARDIIGEKPLFYTKQADYFAFASEMKPLLKELPINREINSLAIQSFFAFSRPVGDLCIYKEIKKLLPKQLLRLELNTGEIKISDYWDLNRFRIQSGMTLGDAKKKLLSLLEETIPKFLVADVPIGAFLSGGTDSSAMVAMMRKFFNHPVKTFTVIYDDERISEAKEARQVAEYLGTDHYEILIKPEDVAPILPKLISHLEEPFADASFVPAYFVSKKAREQVTVAITGDGGDELFGGYSWYRNWKLLEWYRKIPRLFRKIWEPLVLKFPSRHKYLDGAKRIIRAAQEPDDLGAFLQLSGRSDLHQLFSKKETISLLYDVRRHIIFEKNNLSSLEKIMLFQLQSLLPELFFTKLDRMSMANSLETRSPLVYRDIVEFVVGLPLSYKIRGGVRKYLLKKVFEKYLPKEIIYRPKKGFSIPFYRWLREDVKLRQLVEEAVFGEGVEERYRRFGINYDYLKNETEQYLAGKSINWVLSWRAVCFHLWWSVCHSELVEESLGHSERSEESLEDPSPMAQDDARI